MCNLVLLELMREEEEREVIQFMKNGARAGIGIGASDS